MEKLNDKKIRKNCGNNINFFQLCSDFSAIWGKFSRGKTSFTRICCVRAKEGILPYIGVIEAL